MSDEATGKTGRMWLYCIGMLVGLPLLYVFSTGPILVLSLRGALPPEPALKFFAPLIWAIPESSSLGNSIKSYLELWVNLTGTEALIK